MNPRHFPMTGQPIVRLGQGALHSFTLPRNASAQICARSGTCWITVEGDAEDHVLRAGETVCLCGSGRVIIEPLGGAAAFELC
jgi:hypothetical protein